MICPLLLLPGTIPEYRGIRAFSSKKYSVADKKMALSPNGGETPSRKEGFDHWPPKSHEKTALYILS